MFYKEDYTFELGTYASSQQIAIHLRLEAMFQSERTVRACKDQNIDLFGKLNFELKDLSYMWALNLELGVETLAIYREGLEIPVVVIDSPTPWKDQPHHKHMAEFVNHHIGKSDTNRRQHGADFILRMLNQISVKFLNDEIRDLQMASTDESARRALLTIDAGK